MVFAFEVQEMKGLLVERAMNRCFRAGTAFVPAGAYFPESANSRKIVKRTLVR